MADSESKTDFPDEAQRYAVCQSKWDESKMTALEKYRRTFATPQRISFDYDETLTQAKEVARRWIAKGAEVYIISARHNKEGMLKTAADLGIPASRVYATGSNKSKIEIIQKLKIDKHYDNNPDVIKQLGVHGTLWVKNADTYTDYPQQATENAKIALRWVEKNGWGSCGEATGKARANQLANREPISEDTISRMASFARHRQNSQRELGDGCGRLMWLAWGGDEGIEWASRKLEQIRNGKA